MEKDVGLKGFIGKKVKLYFRAFKNYSIPKLIEVEPTKTIKQIKEENLKDEIANMKGAFAGDMFLFFDADGKESAEPLKDC